MTSTTQSRTRKGDWFLFDFALIVGIFAILVGVLLSAGHIGPVDDPRARALYECSAVQAAVMNYYNEYGVMPDVSNNAALIETLTCVTPTGGQPLAASRRNNPHGVPFLNVLPTDLNDKGELIDPWGTPYHISIAKSTIHVRSAGSDKIFGTPDDITNQ